ncbi:MAG: FtsX-like permease family protein [Candidatus Faecousia sp.]|nr:FtsX-like permease family protein [Candidatus Faecousia sp.]
MKFGFYPRLARDGIRKNKRLYVPYLLTCVGMVMMFYIIHYLAAMRVLNDMAGGRTTAQMLGFGTWIVMLFALIFLFYTNSFLMRRRKKEFGLYNILGMGKGNLSRMLLWEALIMGALSLALGLLGGVALSKLAELCLTRILHGTASFDFTVNLEAFSDTVIVFMGIFGLIFLKNLIQIWRLSAVSLIRSENVGEKPPRANYLLGIGGLLLLGAAYYLAVSIQSPLMALSWFFVAVAMVIVATYLIFISGSVMLCRLLQKNRNYYYRKNHFVAVSSMAYRMKRNGAGLASICILATMVLVMISSTFSLYIGMEDSIQTRYPHDSGFGVDMERLEYLDDAHTAQVRSRFESLFREENVEPRNVEQYRYASISGILEGGRVDPDSSAASYSTLDYSTLRTITFIPVEDYNALNGTALTLEPGQALVGCLRCEYDEPSFRLGDMTLEIAGKLPKNLDTGESVVSVVPSITLVVSDLQELAPLDSLADYKGRKMLETRYYYGCDFDLPEEQIIQLHQQQKQAIMQVEFLGKNHGYGWIDECPAQEREGSYITFGGLFFIGIMLSGVFIAAAALMIYYKQISEGYEDQSRFAIMRKVGMTRQDIKKSINSQILTVFFAPLLMAGLHLAFAFPMVWQILQMFNLRNLKLVIASNVGSFLVFCLFYVIIYKLTAGAYYTIVSDDP